MGQIQVPVEWLRDTDLVGNESDASVRVAAIRGNMVGFLRDSHNKVCEWRPGRYATASLLWDWGSPCRAYGITHPIIHPRVEFHAKQRGARGDIFCLIGCAYSQLEIDDFKRDACSIMPRYSILITPVWVQDLARPIGGGFWTSGNSPTRQVSAIYVHHGGGFTVRGPLIVTLMFPHSYATFGRYAMGIRMMDYPVLRTMPGPLVS